MNEQRLLLTAILAVCTALTGCLTPSAVDDFEKVSAQSATLFPAVASIPYNSCVTREKNLQLATVTDFNGTFDFDQTKIASACKAAQDTSERLTKTYAVLTAYVTALDKLAGGNTPTYDTNIKGAATTIPGLSTSQQTAVSGLTSLVADLVDKHYRRKEAADAIHKAQPLVHDLSVMLQEQLPPLARQHLDNELASLGSFYRDAARFRVKNDPNKPTIEVTDPILVTASFTDKQVVIQQERDAISAFEAIFVKIDEGHTALDKKRNKLFDKTTIQDLFQTASAIKTGVDAVEAAFKPSAGTAPRN
jgi:hypothetical protein